MDFLESIIDPYYMQIIILIEIYIIMALGLNLITGMTGQLSLGHAAFMSIGAYGAGIGTLKLGLSFYPALLLGAVLAALFGILLGFPTLRLWGDYLAITTLGFGEIVRVLLLNMKITGGALGLSPIPSYTNIINVTILAGLVIWAMTRIEDSRFGRALQAIREDEIAAGTSGINCTMYKIQAFAVGAFCAGLGGGLYAHYIKYINPIDFGFMKSIEILNMVVLGGLGSIPGTVIGAGILTAAPEILRFMANYRMLVYGIILVLLMIFRPNGLMGGVSFNDILKKALLRAKSLRKPARGVGK